jgi:hypothetical protein
MRRGASRTAEYRLQLTITAVARPVRRSVVRRVVLAAELSGFVARPDGGEGGPRPACGVHPSGSVSGIRLSSRLVSSPSGVRSPGVVVQGSAVRPSGVRPSGVHPSSVQPSAVHSVRPDASGRLIPHQAVALGDQVEAAGNRHTGMERGLWAAAPSGGSVDGQGGWAGDAAEVARGSVGCRWRIRAGLGQGGVRSACRCGCAVDRGTGYSARWPHPPRGCRPRLGLRPQCVVVAEPDARVGGPVGATGGAGGDARAAPARPRPAANAPGSLPTVL